MWLAREIAHFSCGGGGVPRSSCHGCLEQLGRSNVEHRLRKARPQTVAMTRAGFSRPCLLERPIRSVGR